MLFQDNSDQLEKQIELYDEILTEKREKLDVLDTFFLSTPEIDLQRQTLREEIANLEIQKAQATHADQRQRGSIERDLDMFED